MASERPEWWEWELELTPHLERRMDDRSFSEVDLRAMFESVRRIVPDRFEGRWIVETTLGRRDWMVIVEPDLEDRLVVVVTAYPVEVR